MFVLVLRVASMRLMFCRKCLLGRGAIVITCIGVVRMMIRYGMFSTALRLPLLHRLLKFARLLELRYGSVKASPRPNPMVILGSTCGGERETG
jgi:hypothetical protein